MKIDLNQPVSTDLNGRTTPAKGIISVALFHTHAQIADAEKSEALRKKIEEAGDKPVDLRSEEISLIKHAVASFSINGVTKQIIDIVDPKHEV